MHRAALLIGGNQGDRHSLLLQATDLIRQRIGSVALLSSIHETEPWGDFEIQTSESEIQNFLNQALVVDTLLSPHDLLREALAIEHTLGRRRPASTDCSPCQGELPAGVRGESSRVFKRTSEACRNTKELEPIRKTLRSNATSAEAFLWTYLKNKQLSGYRFRRQYSIEKYILDFYCPALRLAVELDGDVHYDSFSRQREYDLQRDEYLHREYGVKVVRFENRMVFEHLSSVIGWIENAIVEQGGVVVPYDWTKYGAPGCSPCQGELPAGVRGGCNADTVLPLRPSATSPCEGEEPDTPLTPASAVQGRLYHSRPIDIDIIFYDHAIISTPDLTVPHPRMHLRSFVLEPLAEVMPDYVHPLLHKTVKQLLSEL